MSGAAHRAEIQLGHLCNNRCVFCISGELTRRREAPLLPAMLIRDRLREIRAAGARHLTFLGGEPTVQPSFMEVLEYAVELGFETIVIFSNGTRLHREGVLERILETGGRFEFRFSFQGGDEESHERTTRRKGSWAQLVASLDRARALGQKVTVNMCVVQSNHASIASLPALLEPRGVAHLHLDMIHPDDTPVAKGVGGPALDRIVPRYTDVARSLRRMADGFGPEFPFSVGNLPHCVAPSLARHIHHGGVETRTSTAGIAGTAALDPGHDKYAEKRENKRKPPRCRQCVFDPQCSGVFAQYEALYGLGELTPVAPSDLVRAGVLAPGLGRLLGRLREAAPFGALRWERIELPRRDRLEVHLAHPAGGGAVVWFAPAERPRAGYELKDIDPSAPPAGLTEGLRDLFAVAEGAAGRTGAESEPAPRPASGSRARLETRSG